MQLTCCLNMQMLNHANLGSTCATTRVVSLYAHSPCKGFVRKKFKLGFLVIGKPGLLQLATSITTWWQTKVKAEAGDEEGASGDDVKAEDEGAAGDESEARDTKTL